MSDPAIPTYSPREAVCREIISKCSSLRAAAHLLPGLAGRDSEEMLGLMTEQARRLAKVLEMHRDDRRAK
jgi:hypothetical protein